MDLITDGLSLIMTPFVLSSVIFHKCFPLTQLKIMNRNVSNETNIVYFGVVG